MKRMLFNATHAEELRVAIVEGQKLIDIDIESAGHESRKSNIYKGVITRVEPSLEACFINYGEERHGFLPFKEISKVYFKQGTDAGKARIQDALSEGQELVVQVEKEERGNKGAALTTFISLAGRYLVLMPNNPRGGGVSRRIEGEDRQELRDAMDQLDIPQGMSIIARTAGIGRTAEELQWDLNYLLQLWRAVDSAAGSAGGPFLIYQESSLVIRAIRDYFTADIGEILIDTEDVCEQARQFMAHVMPDNVERVKRYRDDIPLFSRFQIEHQIETAYSRIVPLPSGGSIVVDHTEALVAIDVNSARATRGGDIEETALRTNLEAADEAARQMRLRDLGGLIVVDFIDMENNKNQREVEQRLKDALHYDRARVQTGKISRFGLMELSRQRLRPALNEGTHITCPRCNGTGVIRDIESSALHVLRVVQEEAMKESTASVHAQVPVEVATYLLNEKRGEIAKMEARLKIEIILIPNRHIETPHYRLERLRHDDERLNTYRASYTIADAPTEEASYLDAKLSAPAPRQEAVVKSVTPDQPAPKSIPAAPSAPASHSVAVGAIAPASSEGLFGRILKMFRRAAANETIAPAPKLTTSAAAPSGAAASGAEPGAGDRGRRDRDDTRRDRGRGSRGGRGRGDEAGRDSRGRDNRGRGPRRDERAGEDSSASRRAPASSQAEGDGADVAAQPPREPRPRRGRGPRNGEAREADTSVAASTVAALTEAGIAGESAAESSVPALTATERPGSEQETDEGADADGRRPRRRRRGGRRGRSDRDTDVAADASAVEGGAQASDEAVADTDVEQQPRQSRGRGRGRGRQDQAADAVEQQAGAVEASATDTATTMAPDASQPADAETHTPVDEVPVHAAVEEVAHVEVAQVARPSVRETPEPAAIPEPLVAEPVAEEPAAATGSAQAEPAQVAPAQVAPAHVAPAHVAPAQEAAPAQAAPTPPAPAQPTPAAPATEAPPAKEELESIVAEAGLQWVQTRQGELGFSAEPEPPQARPVRARKPRAKAAEQPLMQVETRPD